MTTRETELERQLSHIIKECEASSTQSKRIQRIKARAEAAINGSDPDFKSVGDRRDDKIAHIGQLNMMNAQLQSTIAALDAEVLRLREALEHLSKAAGQTIDVRTPEDWVNLNIGLSLSIQAMSTPFTPTALNELIEKAEKMTIERCAGVCKTLDRKEKRHAAGYGPGYLTYTASDCEQIIRALPTGQIKLLKTL